jgi:hypothetical protein
MSNTSPQLSAPKRKKGRPRKEPVVEDQGVQSTEVVEKKRRGRKPKEVQPVDDTQVVKKKKRGRKPQLKFYSSSIRKQIPLTTQLQDNDNYILHLDAPKEELEDAKEYDCFEEQPLRNNIKEPKDEQYNDDDVSTQESSVDIFEKDYKAFVDNDDAILSEFIDGNMEDLRDLYERRIKFREDQDQLLVDKLERLHKDDSVLDKLINARYASNKAYRKKTTTDAETSETGNAEHGNTGQYEMLLQFVEKASWLHKTNLSCWWCCHSFDGVPLGLPVKFVPSIQKFRCQGVFCSFSCMMAFHNEHNGKGESHLIKYLYSKVTGTPLPHCRIHPAPPRWCLSKFGGPLSLNQFRQSSKENKIYKMVEYPMFVSRDYIEEVDIANVKNANSRVFTDSNKHTNVGIVGDLDQRKVEEAKQRMMQKKDTVVTMGNTIETFIKFGP